MSRHGQERRKKTTMFTIRKKENAKGAVYPDEEFLQDYQDADIGSMISTAGIDAVLGMGTREIGDFGIIVEISDTLARGDAGIEQLKKYTDDFVSIIKEAVPKMSQQYADFYQFFLDDYEKNGIIMPMYGKL